MNLKYGPGTRDTALIPSIHFTMPQCHFSELTSIWNYRSELPWPSRAMTDLTLIDDGFGNPVKPSLKNDNPKLL
jgi:hypothetical protein